MRTTRTMSCCWCCWDTPSLLFRYINIIYTLYIYIYSLWAWGVCVCARAISHELLLLQVTIGLFVQETRCCTALNTLIRSSLNASLASMQLDCLFINAFSLSLPSVTVAMSDHTTILEYTLYSNHWHIPWISWTESIVNCDPVAEDATRVLLTGHWIAAITT